MPDTAAGIGYGTDFAVKGVTLFESLAEVTAVTPPGMTREAVEATHLKSPDGFKEFIAGLKEGGEAALTLNYLPSALDALVAAFDAGAGEYRITFPNGVTMTFKGIFTGFEIGELTPEGKMSASATVKCSGRPVLAAGV